MRPLISALLPAPSMIVVLSLSMTIFLARPSSATVMFSSFRPRLSNRAVPPVTVARGLDGRHAERAAKLVDHQRGQGLAVDLFGHDQQRLAGVDHGFQY